MKKKLIGVLCLVFMACTGNDEFVPDKATVMEQPDGNVVVSQLLYDPATGLPIPCSSDAICEPLVPRDECFNGAACKSGFCEEMIWGSCCESVQGHGITCSKIATCTLDVECDDNNICTEDACNPYLLQGACTHAFIFQGESLCGIGVCQMTVPVCKEGKLNPDSCPEGGDQTKKTSEVCDGLDNDCDGIVDEDWPDKGKECTVGLGVCIATGAYVCKADGSGLECNAVPGLPTGTDTDCNSLDEDCDGTADEHYVPIVACFKPGVCAAGNMASSCTAGVETACATGPVTGPDSDCNSLDEDCDNTADEHYVPVTGCFLPGVCAVGNVASSCAAGVETACQTGTPTGIDADCNSVDEDCDGTADEHYVPVPTTCGVGVCASSGQLVCTAGQVVDTCKPGNPSSEVCDSLDNDCDGATDEALSQYCYTGQIETLDVGPCHGGSQTCAKGLWGNCLGEVIPSPEICDGVDNDCNNVVDDADACTVCHNPAGKLTCGATVMLESFYSDSFPFYSCKPTWNESGGEGMMMIDPSPLGGVKWTVIIKSFVPAAANPDLFVLSGTECATASCLAAGDKAAQFVSVAEVSYYVVVDGYNGLTPQKAEVSAICVEGNCEDGLDNDGNGMTDCVSGKADQACNCGSFEDCTNGLDDNNNGLVDCEDPICYFADNCAPTCNTPQAIACGESKSGTTVNKTNSMSGYNCTAVDESGPEAVYKFVAASTGAVTATLAGLSADLDVVVLADTCQANKCLVFGNNAATFTAVSGHTYYIVADGFAGNSGSYTLSLACAPPPM